MAGNRFIKKLQALKSRMMFEDTPVDPSRRKLFTLPPEETSQSLPVPQTSKPESLLNQLANKPVDRREFLKQAGQSAKSAAVRGILPELGALVKPAASSVSRSLMSQAAADKVIRNTLNNYLLDNLFQPLSRVNKNKGYFDFIDFKGLYDDIVDNYADIPESVEKSIRKSSTSVAPFTDEEDEFYADAVQKVLKYIPTDFLPKIIDDLSYDFNLEGQVLKNGTLKTVKGFTPRSMAELLYKQNVPRENIHSFIEDSHIGYDEDDINDILNKLDNDLSE